MAVAWVAASVAMTIRVATIIIEPHLLVREAFESLMEGHSYHVVYGANSTAEIGDAAIAGSGPRLAIMAEQSIDDAVKGALDIRKLWPACKIVLLFKYASADDFQKLLGSQIDGCVPLSVSPDTLIRTLDMIVSGDARVVVLAGPNNTFLQPALLDGEKVVKCHAISSQTISVAPESLPLVAIKVPHHAIALHVNGGSVSSAHDQKVGSNEGVQSRQCPRLSDRETQILDGLVRGQTNKVIARVHEITEATVKVHMKSILRKIQVANRTQAAIWALEHGYSTDEIKDRLLMAAEDA